MKVLFLDMDGVMNGVLLWPARAPRTWIDPAAVARLNRIIRATGAVLVITSSWRLIWDVPSLLREAGVDADVIGEVPHFPQSSRGREIAAWLDAHAVTAFAILDDDADMDELTPHLVQSTWTAGLEERHVAQAIELLR